MSRNRFTTGGLFSAKKVLRESETSISNTIAKYLNARRIFNFRVQAGRIQTKQGHWIHFADKGTPDRFCLYNERAVFIEVKRIGEKPTDDQLRVHGDIRSAGGIVIVAERLEDVIEGLNKI